MISSILVRRVRAVSVLVSLFAGCGGDVAACPAGTVASGDGCVIVEDAGLDASRDAAPLDAPMLDLNVADACTPSVPDVVDADGLDTNCDGVDGILAELVFVAVSGDDSNSGLRPDSPVRSVSRGVSVAGASGLSTILVGAGAFTEGGPLEFGDVGMIAGGYGPTWRGTRTNSRIACPRALVHGGGPPRVLDHIALDVAAASVRSAFGVVVEIGAMFELIDGEIVVGDGAQGALGRVTLTTAPSASGSVGSTCAPTGVAPCTAGPAPRTAPPPTRCGAVTAGGVGAGEFEAGGNGAGGLTAGGAPGVTDPGPGENGAPGMPGAAGAGAVALGTMRLGGFGMEYVQPFGADGSVGAGPGQGGGGGGGAALTIRETGVCPDATRVAFTPSGSGGGSGGLGGCPGAGGAGGESGGASIGIVAELGSRVTLTRSTIRTGLGGNGGSGSVGAPGGMGGAGGPGGAPACQNVVGGVRDVGRRGAAGGRGGDGGPGGAGGGGSGGPSIGAWLQGDAVLVQDAAVITPGRGGEPGLSDGSPGMLGMSIDIYTEP